MEGRSRTAQSDRGARSGGLWLQLHCELEAGINTVFLTRSVAAVSILSLACPSPAGKVLGKETWGLRKQEHRKESVSNKKLTWQDPSWRDDPRMRWCLCLGAQQSRKGHSEMLRQKGDI